MNKVLLMGRLTKDPVVRYTPTQKVVCQFTLAVDRSFVNKDGQREADFIPVVLCGKQAELAGNSCGKGHRLFVEGRMQVRTYEDQNKKTIWVTEVIGDHIEFIERKAGKADTGTSSSTNKQGYESIGEEVPSNEEVPF